MLYMLQKKMIKIVTLLSVIIARISIFLKFLILYFVFIQSIIEARLWYKVLQMFIKDFYDFDVCGRYVHKIFTWLMKV